MKSQVVSFSKLNFSLIRKNKHNKYASNFIFLSLIYWMTLLLGCNWKKGDIIDLFEKKISIKHNIYNERKGSFLRDPYHMVELDSCLIFLDPDNYNVLSLFDLNSPDTIIRFAKRGEGPLEIMQGGQISLSDTDSANFELFDIQKQKLFIFNIDSIRKKNYFPLKIINLKNNYGRFYKGRIVDSSFIGTGDLYNKMYLLYNLRKDSSFYFSEFPFQNEISNIPKGALSLVYQGTIEKRPYKSEFIFACRKTPFIEILKASNDSLLSIKKIYSEPPKIKGIVTESLTTYTPLEDNKNGFIDMYVCDKYFFLLYSGRTAKEYKESTGYGRNILVFDWKGNAILNIELDIDVSGFAISRNFKRIYAIGREQDPIIVSFNLEDSIL